jgi:hypothetical protein
VLRFLKLRLSELIQFGPLGGYITLMELVKQNNNEPSIVIPTVVMTGVGIPLGLYARSKYNEHLKIREDRIEQLTGEQQIIEKSLFRYDKSLNTIGIIFIALFVISILSVQAMTFVGIYGSSSLIARPIKAWGLNDGIKKEV